MNTITLQEIKTRGARAIPDDQVTFLIVHSKPKSVLVPPQHYEMLVESFEELEDMKSIKNRKQQKSVGWNSIFSKRRR